MDSIGCRAMDEALHCGMNWQTVSAGGSARPARIPDRLLWHPSRPKARRCAASIAPCGWPSFTKPIEPANVRKVRESHMA
jgi:hypothetical protein